MPFGMKDLDPRPQLECAKCGHKERASPTHAAAAIKDKGHVKCAQCGGLMWMPGFGPTATAAPAISEPVPLETAYVRRGDAGFGIVLDDGATVVGGPGHTCETIPLGATIVSVNGVDVNSKAEIVACIKDVAVSGQAEFTYRPVALEPAPEAPPVAEEDDVAAAATAGKLKQLDEAFAIGALTEESYIAAKLRLIEPPGAGVDPSPRDSPPTAAEPEPEPAAAAATEGVASLSPVDTQAEPGAEDDDELTPRTEAEIASKYLGGDHASEAAAVLSGTDFEPEPEPEPARASASGVLGGLASIDLDPRPLLECSNPSCGNKERAKVTDGVNAVGAFLSSSNHHVKCSQCGSLLWMPGATKPAHSQASAATIESWTREFESSVPEGWDQLTKKAAKHSRSTLIRLRNRATTPLKLGPAETNVVESGMWIVEPVPSIAAGEEVVFGIGSKGLLRESGIGAAEGKLVYVLEPPDEIDPYAPELERVEFMIDWRNPVMSVPNVNERRCTAASTPVEGGCGIIHVGAVSDDHNNVVCITVAEPPPQQQQGGGSGNEAAAAPPPDLYVGIRAEKSSETAAAAAAAALPSPPPAAAGSPTAAAAAAVVEEDPLAGLTLLQLAERAGLDAELLEGMLEAMDGDEAMVEAMLREQAAANPQPPPSPAPAPAPELSEEELAER